jgi:hypothetical protein
LVTSFSFCWGLQVILKNVLPYLERFPEADILVSSDHLSSTLNASDHGLEIPSLAGSCVTRLMRNVLCSEEPKGSTASGTLCAQRIIAYLIKLCTSFLASVTGSPMNIGIMMFRYNKQTEDFVNTWLDTINARPDYWV